MIVSSSLKWVFLASHNWTNQLNPSIWSKQRLFLNLLWHCDRQGGLIELSGGRCLDKLRWDGLEGAAMPPTSLIDSWFTCDSLTKLQIGSPPPGIWWLLVSLSLPYLDKSMCHLRQVAYDCYTICMQLRWDQFPFLLQTLCGMQPPQKQTNLLINIICKVWSAVPPIQHAFHKLRDTPDRDFINLSL